MHFRDHKGCHSQVQEASLFPPWFQRIWLPLHIWKVRMTLPSVSWVGHLGREPCRRGPHRGLCGQGHPSGSGGQSTESKRIILKP